MSAYALPGLIPGISSSPSAECEMGNSSASDDSVDRISQSPLHEQRDTTSFSGLLRASVDLLSVPSFTGSVAAFKSDAVSSKTSSSDDTRLEEPGIAVREAKIDPVRLIQSVTGSRSQQVPRKTLRRKGSRERLLSENSSPHSSPVTTKQTITFGEDEKGQSSPSSPSKTKSSPHDDAISFELSISWNGRKYTATRTLQCIMQLRDDLIQEMNGRRQWLNIRKAASNAFQQSKAAEDFHDSFWTPNSSSQEDITIEIPEIPPLAGEESNGGFVGRGFTMLHAMATSYVPVMERWFHNVMAIVPQDSECLTNFLWEPLSHEGFASDLPSKSCNSLATLGSIKELDYNTEDDSDEDDW
mmetsp:Transcript_111424/g.322126  ORF Transcript_111424/g.322126 Transcript_111424/m.322126 type:complete len:356 (-) Transcript_111424:48-1115(-)|eukprot:CAMPEP_0176002238 /NCGR_PEP_ID=MMETSP0120_2-20121206/543_1 /TAXON_ID=160619 /ORGANISM="Kryptoperidinium foliaceum, Strain CCMP 1326" /LENGTH=355 /DNA_ID=CAMNT_0017334819 /DNA_START=298 /DNA_END=1365 /DNA_ORIENTATION=+